ncbi:discoidin domain-containing protein [Blastococcus sp. SYSU DS0539]
MTLIQRRLLLVPATLAVVALAGCAGSGTQGAVDPGVRAAEQVFVEPPAVVPDPSGTSATLQVTTSMDMACAVVFGRDESLGEGTATDADMGGGAHAEHRAVMRGLEPDTEYFYRVQGSGADGSLYRSELRSFRTPPAEVAAAPGPSASLGAVVVDVSSAFSAAYAAANAVDGDLGTEWSSDGDGDDASVTLDMGRQVDVVGVALRSRAMSDGSAIIETFTVTVDDGQTYGPFEAGTTAIVNATDFTGRVLRIDAGTTSGGNTGAAEIELYERP